VREIQLHENVRHPYPH